MTAGETKSKKIKDKQKTCSAGNVEPKAKPSKPLGQAIFQIEGVNFRLIWIRASLNY